MELIYGERKVRAVLGDGVKRLAPSEKANYARTNRSIHFLRSMKKGERIGERDIALLRTEKVLNPGLGPEFLERAIGSVLARDVQDGAGLEWEDLLAR
jgi:sialic acid synthase SpsE